MAVLTLQVTCYFCLQDFEELVLKDYQRYNSLYGLEKFWAFHHYSGLPADNSVEVCPQLKALLEGPFKNLDCFREEQQRRRAVLEVRKMWQCELHFSGATGHSYLASSSDCCWPELYIVTALLQQVRSALDEGNV
jgi:hypothetical protein